MRHVRSADAERKASARSVGASLSSSAEQMKEKRFAGGIYYFDVVAALIGVVLVLGHRLIASGTDAAALIRDVPGWWIPLLAAALPWRCGDEPTRKRDAVGGHHRGGTGLRRARRRVLAVEHHGVHRRNPLGFPAAARRARPESTKTYLPICGQRSQRSLVNGYSSQNQRCANNLSSVEPAHSLICLRL